jgi:hypothetical protein
MSGPNIDVSNMADQRTPASLHVRARIVGIVYLLYFVTAFVGQGFIQQVGINGSDAAATAQNLVAHEAAFRAGIAFGLISLALYIALTALFYQVFRPVSGTLALLAAFFGLVGCILQAVGSVFQGAALLLVGGGNSLGALTADQAQALALVLLKLNSQANAVDFVFFALFLLINGYLILRSTFLPRFLGVLPMLAGVAGLTLLWPPLANSVALYIEVLAGVAEGLLMLWLLVIGVNIQRWKEQADHVTAAGASFLA